MVSFKLIIIQLYECVSFYFYYILHNQTIISLSSAYGVECDSIGAMKSLCTFSVFMMLSYIFELIVLLKFKDDLLGNGPLDEGIGGVGAGSSAGSLLPEPRGMYARVDAVSMEYG